MRRSSILVAAVIATTIGASQAAATTTTRSTRIDGKTVRAHAKKVIAQERAGKFNARERIGVPFTVKLKSCTIVLSSDYHGLCSYWIEAKDPTSTWPDGTQVRRRCVVQLKNIRRSKRTRRVTHTRVAHPCYEPQPPIVGPPVH